VRWSDGSRQLLLGDEVLDVAEQDVAGDQHYLFVRHQGLIQVRMPGQTAVSDEPKS
jgi:RNA polymerase-associated protein LEO1